MIGTHWLAWVVLGIGVVVHAVAGAADLTPERLTAQEWRAFSDVSPTLPGDGYPIRLRPQGTVETANLARVTQWMLNSAGELALPEKDGESPQSAFPPLVLAPPGSTITSVDEGLRALGLTRCGPRPR